MMRPRDLREIMKGKEEVVSDWQATIALKTR